MRNHFRIRGRSPENGRRVRHADRRQGIPSRWHARLRRGISLLEVLFAVFILSMGMLGLGALIPVANFQVSQGLRADHSSACARAAFRILEARGLLDSRNWRNVDGDPPSFISGGNAQWPTFMLDPMFIARGGEGTYPVSGGLTPTMGRLTLPGMKFDADTDVRRQAIARAESIFRWRDDLPGGSKGERPVLIAGNGDNSISAHEGSYSWMAMVTPSPLESTVAAKIGAAATKRMTYNVAVIVFYKRDLAPAAAGKEADHNVQQLWPASFNPATLTLTFDVTGGMTDLKIVPGQWIMLSHRINNGTGVNNSMPYHRWYRVVSAGNRYRATGSGANIPLHVQLEGPPWPDNALLASADLPTVTVHQGVVGVYERTIEFDPSIQ